MTKIIKLAYNSHKKAKPETFEGKILHDAHMIEGGKTFLVVKSLITGSVRGQSLQETIKYIEDNILDKGYCYLPQAQKVYIKQQQFCSKRMSIL